MSEESNVNWADPLNPKLETITTAGGVTLEFFPSGYTALNKELGNGLHEDLAQLLSNFPVDEIDIRLARIAAFCGVVLDGTYTLEERNNLCHVLTGRLEVLRVIPANGSLNLQ